MKILEITSNLRLRLDYFSMPDILGKIVQEIHSILDVDVPENRMLNTYDQELLDLDSISSVLDVTLEEVLRKPVAVFTKTQIAGYQARIYISEYFFFISINITDDKPLKGFEDVCKGLYRILDVVLKQKAAFSIRRLSTTVFAPCIIDIQDIEKNLKIDYFPIIKERGLNARYAEKSDNGHYMTDVIRDVSSGNIDDGDKVKEVYRIEISVNNYVEKIPEDENLQFFLLRMYEGSVGQTNKYFYV